LEALRDREGATSELTPFLLLPSIKLLMEKSPERKEARGMGALR